MKVVPIKVTAMKVDPYDCDPGDVCLFEGGEGTIKIKYSGESYDLFDRTSGKDGVKVGTYKVVEGTRLTIQIKANWGNYTIKFKNGTVHNQENKNKGGGLGGSPANGTIKVSTGRRASGTSSP